MKKGEEHSEQESNVSTDKMMATFPGNQFRLGNLSKVTR